MSNDSTQIAEVVFGLPVNGPFDYQVLPSIPGGVHKGDRVVVKFRNRKCVGYVVGLKDTSDFEKLNPVLKRLDATPLFDECLLEFSFQFSKYHACSWGEAIELFIPACLKRLKSHQISRLGPRRSFASLPAPQLIIDPSRQHFWPKLIKVIAATLRQQGNVLLIVPEQNMVDSVKRDMLRYADGLFDPFFICWQARQKVNDVMAQWNAIRSARGQIVIGARSAVFLPIDAPLIIVLGEDHDAYKQEQSPYYHVFSTVLLRTAVIPARLMVTSSVPRTETWHHAVQQQWSIQSLETVDRSCFRVIDTSNFKPGFGSRWTFPLRQQIQQVVDGGGQVLIYANRRGYTTMTRCEVCEKDLHCPNCDSPVIHLLSKRQWVCSHCDFMLSSLPKCPHCQQRNWIAWGRGIERLAEDVKKLFPQYQYQVMEGAVQRIPSKKADIILSTRFIWHRFPDYQADLVVLLELDPELYRVDYRSTEKALRLIFQLSQMSRQEVWIQTSMPDLHLFDAGLSLRWNDFYKKELKLREDLQLPPLARAGAFLLRGLDEADVSAVAHDLHKTLNATMPQEAFMIHPPHPDVIPRLRGQFRYRLNIHHCQPCDEESHSIRPILESFKNKKKHVIVTYDAEP